MTRDEAIALRTQQLSGQAVDSALLAQALVVIAQPAPARGRGRPRKGDVVTPARKQYNPVPTKNRLTNDPPGLLASKARHNRVLIVNLRAAGVVW